MSDVAKLSQMILEKIDSSDNLDDMLLNDFSIAADNSIFSQKVDIHDFEELYTATRRIKHFAQKSTTSDAMLFFTYGFLFSKLESLQQIAILSTRQKNINFATTFYNKYYNLFDIIQNNPGITHKNLADNCKTSVSALSQLLSRNSFSLFIMGEKRGREKYYYLTKSGQELYIKLKENKSIKSSTFSFKDKYNFNDIYVHTINYAKENTKFNSSRAIGMILNRALLVK